jgi:lipoprotein-releasing system permease protein
MARGRYLRPGETGVVVLGQAIANRLSADLDDEILATAVGRDGDINSILLRIVGIVRTGSDEIDATICQVPLQDVERVTGLDGAGEVTLVLDDWRTTDGARAALARTIAGPDRVVSWGDISPDFKGHMEQDKAMSRLVSAIILVIVLLGVASAQLAAVLERRREFAVLAALGMRSRTILALLLDEALAIGVAGAGCGLVLGLPLVWYLARYGLDFSNYMGSSYSFQGVLIEPKIFGDFGLWTVWYAFAVSVAATALASVYPAWFAARTNPADALRVA